MPTQTPDSAAPNFPADDEVEAIERDLPPLDENPENIPQSGIPGSTAETTQQDGQFHSRMRREAEEEEEAAAAISVAELVERYSTGYFRVERIGPSDLPRTEIGDLGKLKIRDFDVNADIREIVTGQYGGGDFRLTLFGARGREIAKVPPILLELGGDIKPRSRDGHAYLNRKVGPDAMQDASGMTAMVGLLRDVSMKPQAPPPAEGKGTAELLQLLAAVTGPQMQMMQSLMAQANSSKDKELAEIRARSEREERESREKIAKEEIASKERIALAQAEAAARLADAQAGRKYDYLGQKAVAEMNLRAAELRQAGPLGVDGAKQVRQMAIKSAIEAAQAVGAPEDEGSGVSSLLRGLVEEHGERIFDILDRMVPDRSQQAGAPRLPAPARQNPAATPAPASSIDVSPGAPAAPGAPQEPGAASETALGSEPSTEAAALPPPDPAAPMDERDAIRLEGMKRVNQFLNAVSIQMKLDGDAAAAWDEPIDENPRHDLAWLYGRLPTIPRTALAEAGWPGLRSTLDPTVCEAATGYYDRELVNGPRADWFAAFIESGPWTEDEEG